MTYGGATCQRCGILFERTPKTGFIYCRACVEILDANQPPKTMKYRVKGHNVDLTFEGEEITEALEVVNPESELLKAFQQYREAEFAKR